MWSSHDLKTDRMENKKNETGGIRMRGGIFAAILLIVAMFAAMPAEAYTVVGDKNAKVVRLYFSGNEAGMLAAYPWYAANAVTHEANLKGISVERSKRSIETEIRGHAMLMLGPNILVPRNGAWRWTHDIANPMDIEMNLVESWVYYLD